MRTTGRFLGRPLCALAVLATWAGAGRAEFIAAGTGLEGLGNFTGRLEYSAAGAGSATLAVELRNTSPLSNGGFLTAFVFDDPAGRITGAALESTNPNFRLLGGAGDRNGVRAPPFGDFDLGASTTGSFLGGGSPRGGIGAGQSATFTFLLSGHGLDELQAADFLRAPPGEGPHHAGFVVRFRGFLHGGSDKVPAVLAVPGGPQGGGVEHAPEPGTLALAGIAVAGLLGWGRARRRPRPEKGEEGLAGARVGARSGSEGPDARPGGRALRASPKGAFWFSKGLTRAHGIRRARHVPS
jgi:hypothetical protein